MGGRIMDRDAEGVQTSPSLGHKTGPNRDWLSKCHSSQTRREFQNQSLGIVWDPKPIRIRDDELIGRLSAPEPIGVVPSWASLLTLAADVGLSGDDYLYYWMSMAWGRHGRGQVVDFDYILGTEDFRRFLLNYSARSADELTVRPVRLGVDSGSGAADTVYTLCRQVPSCWPVKGGSHNPDQPFNAIGSDSPDYYKPGYQATNKTREELADAR